MHRPLRLSAAALERAVRPGSRWLDLGTGSGILAVVAARCGAGAVEAARRSERTDLVRRGLSALAAVLAEEPATPGELSIGWTMRTRLGTGLVPPTDIPHVGRFAVLHDDQWAHFSVIAPLPMPATE